MSEIKITRSKLASARPGRRNPGWLYETTGPDGTRFDNRSIVTLRQVLKRKYGWRNVVYVETWKAAARPVVNGRVITNPGEEVQA